MIYMCKVLRISLYQSVRFFKESHEVVNGTDPNRLAAVGVKATIAASLWPSGRNSPALGVNNLREAEVTHNRRGQETKVAMRIGVWNSKIRRNGEARFGVGL